MRLYKFISIVIAALLLVLQNTVNTGCSKPPKDNPADTTTNPPPPPPVPADTVSLVKKLEVLTSLYPGYGINKYRTYSFLYDAQKRLTEVGIKNYSLVLADTFTTRLFYTGSSKLPNRIIMPDINGSLKPQPPRYDTTWFFYTTDGKLQKDSANEEFYNATTSTYVRNPMIRLYTYPFTNKSTVDWYWSPSATAAAQLFRRDTIKVGANGNPDSIKAVYLYYQTASGAAPGSYALAYDFTFSNTINPLSKLNISGTPYSIIYTNVKKELLGNNSNLLVYNSNGFADYLDFISPVLPTLFHIGGFSPTHQMVGNQACAFPIEITPWALRATYPSEIKVAISTSLIGDKYIYRYTY